MAELTICGKCGHDVGKCTCTEITPATPKVFESVPGINEAADWHRKAFKSPVEVTDEFIQAMGAELDAHKGKGLCDVCKATGSSFGCTKCNSGPTVIRW